MIHYSAMLAGALLGAGAGAAVALRQVSLHVIPRTPHYGAPLLGHLLLLQ
ncbi:hypothetical protein ACPSKX_01380 [Moritella viscosa]